MAMSRYPLPSVGGRTRHLFTAKAKVAKFYAFLYWSITLCTDGDGNFHYRGTENAEKLTKSLRTRRLCGERTVHHLVDQYKN